MIQGLKYKGLKTGHRVVNVITIMLLSTLPNAIYFGHYVPHRYQLLQ